MTNQIRVKVGYPTPDQYIQMREDAGWGSITNDTASKSLESSLFGVCLFDGDTLIGFSRVVGDGILYFYIADVIVAPRHGGRGLGSTLMDAVMEYIHSHAQTGATIAVLSAPGREKFYERSGLTLCPNRLFGHGLSMVKSHDGSAVSRPSS